MWMRGKVAKYILEKKSVSENLKKKTLSEYLEKNVPGK